MDRTKVIARKLDGQIIKGYIETAPEVIYADDISISSLTEKVIEVPKREMKALFFPREFSGNKEYSDVKFFENQPRIEGLWVRVTFYDNEMIEGIVSNFRRLLLDETFYLKPTDANSNNELVCVFKASMKDFSVLGIRYSKLPQP
jgi:hypothetical protein